VSPLTDWVIEWGGVSAPGRLCSLIPGLEHDPLDAAPDRKIATRRATRRQARQMRQRDTGNAVDQCIDIRPAHQFALLLHQAELQQFSLDLEMISVSLRAWRLPPLAPQVSQIGNAALVEE